MAAVVFLRGINLGRRRVTNDQLIDAVTRAGHRHVTAYQASGNLVFHDTDSADEEEIASTLQSALGYEVVVFARSEQEVRAIVADSPIAGRNGSVGGKPQVVFLPRDRVPDLTDVFPDDHEVHLVGPQLHWLPAAGLAEAGDVQARMDRAFGPTTVRTLGTLERLVTRLS